MADWWNDLGPWAAENPWIATMFVVVAMFFATALVRGVVLGRLERLTASTDNDIDDRLVQLARSFLGIVAVFLTALWVLNVHGVELTPLLAGAGIAGIALGFAAKETLADVLAGIFLITDRPMRIGDRVKLEFIGRDWGGWGDVIDVGLRRTIVRNTDGVVVNYPNSVLATSVITNFSQDEQPMRVRVRFQVDYNADVDRVLEIALAAIQATDGVLDGSAEVVVRSLWDDARGHLLAGVLIEGRYRVADVRERTRVRSRVLRAVLVTLREAGVPLPSPRIRVEGTR